MAARESTPWWSPCLLFATVAAAWFWVLDLPLIAVDYDHVHVFPKLLAGEQPFGPLGPRDGPDRPIADSPVFRPWQYLVHGVVNMASGASSWWLHLAGVLMHAGCAVALHRLLLRVAPRGAWIGAFAACTLPLPAQSLTWVNAHALPQCLLAAFVAWLCATRYLERGQRRDLVCVPALLWIAATTKETGLPLVIATPVVGALLAHRLDWRRIGLVTLGCALVLVAWRTCRVASGLPLSLETYGMTFDSSLDALMHSMRRLPDLLAECARTTAMTDVPAEGIDATAALGTADAQARISSLRRVGSWLPHDGLWWTMLGGFAAIGLLRGRAGVRWALLLGIPLTIAMAIPDALHHAPVPALIRKTHPCIVPGLALLIACALEATARDDRRWRRCGHALVAATILLFVTAHGREAAVWHAYAQVPIAWTRAVNEACEEIDGRTPPDAPLGPPALIIVGHPPVLGFDSLVGPTMAQYQQPPLTLRRWTADHVTTPAAAGRSEVARFWPWEIAVLETPGMVAAPTYRRVLPPHSPPSPVTIHDTRDGFTITSTTPTRSVGAVALRWDRDLRPGTTIAVAGAQHPLTLTRGNPAGRALRIELTSMGRSPLDGTPLAATFITSDGCPPSSSAELLHDLPEIPWAGPDSGTVVAFDAPLPELRWRLPLEAPDGFRIHVRADGAEFAPLVPTLAFRIPDALVTTSGESHTSTILRFDPTAWRRTLDDVRRALPDVAAFWLRIRIDGIVGSPSWTIARSRPLLLKIRLRPHREGE